MENKRISARAIIIKNGKILTMFRRKKKDDNTIEYYTIPGGGVEKEESLETAVVRELKEEFGVNTKVIKYVGVIETDKTIEYYFKCEIVDGIPTLGGEELERMTQENYYEIREVDVKEIDNISINAKDFIKKVNEEE